MRTMRMPLPLCSLLTFLAMALLPEGMLGLKKDFFHKIEIGTAPYEVKFDIRYKGVMSVVLPGSFYNKKELALYQNNELELFVDEKPIVPLFPGHNSVQVGNKTDIKILIKAKKGTKLIGKTGYLAYTDNKKISVYPFKPGYPWLNFKLPEDPLMMRFFPDPKVRVPYIFTFGFLNNTAPHALFYGKYNYTKQKMYDLVPQIKSFSVRYAELNMGADLKDDNWHMGLYAASKNSSGFFMISEKKSKAFTMSILEEVVTVKKLEFEVKKASKMGNLTWGHFGGGKPVTLNHIEYHWALFLDREYTGADYFMNMVNTTFGLTKYVRILEFKGLIYFIKESKDLQIFEVVFLTKTLKNQYSDTTRPQSYTSKQRKEEEAIQKGVISKTTTKIKDITLNTQYLAGVLALLQVEGVNTMIDFGFTEVIIKGINPRRVFPYIYSIILVVATCIAVLMLYGILADVINTPYLCYLRHFYLIPVLIEQLKTKKEFPTDKMNITSSNSKYTLPLKDQSYFEFSEKEQRSVTNPPLDPYISNSKDIQLPSTRREHQGQENNMMQGGVLMSEPREPDQVLDHEAVRQRIKDKKEEIERLDQQQLHLSQLQSQYQVLSSLLDNKSSPILLEALLAP